MDFTSCSGTSEPSTALNHKVKRCARFPECHRPEDVLERVDLLPVNADEAVARPDTRLFGRHARHHFSDNGDGHLDANNRRYREQQQGQKTVHGDAGREDDGPLPSGSSPEGLGIVGPLRLRVLAHQVHESPHRNPPQGVLGLSAGPLDDRRSHAQGELPHPDATPLGGHEVPQFVNEDNQPQGDGYFDSV